MENNTILTFDLSRLRVAEQIEFLGVTSDIVAKHDPATMGMEEVLQSLKTAQQDADAKFKQTRNSEITTDLVEKDELRDNDIICLRMWSDAMLRYFDPAVQAAAELMLRTIDNYGSAIYNMNYEEETATLRNLVNDLKTKQPLINAVETLSMRGLVDNLDKNNNEFRQLYMDRLEERTYSNEISAGEAVKLAINNYRVLVRTLEAKAFLQPTEALNKSIAELNTLVERQIEKLANRESRKDPQGQDLQPGGAEMLN